MENKHDEKPSCLGVQADKNAYARPELKIYGEIRLLTQGALTVGVDGANTRKNAQSDRRTKEDIVKIGVHPLGIGLYLFNYKSEFQNEWGNGRQFGVMADEVESVLPEAVSVHVNGYKQVDYNMLGVYRSIH